MANIEEKLIFDEVSEEIVRIAERIVTEDGARDLTVRKILREMGVSNRVFYNRFKNIDQVLSIIATDAVAKMHDSIKHDYDIEHDFFNYVIDVCIKVLYNTYDVKNQFSQYMFELDSVAEDNRIWWTNKIKYLIKKGKDTGNIKDVDDDKLSYTIWCFLRGYNADAVKRKLPKEEAAEGRRTGLGYLFEGIKK